MEATNTPPALTDKIIASRVPEEIAGLVLALGTAATVDDDEVAYLLPSREVINAILAAEGKAQPSSTASLDQAQAWIDEQAVWQNRAMKVEEELQKQFPFTRERAAKGEIPRWVTEDWAPKLIYKWSDGLRNAVLDAEDYIKNKTTGENNG